MSSRPMKICQSDIEEANALVESGNIDLTDARAVFKRVTGENCELTDEQVKIAYMAQTDGEDEDEFVRACRHIATYGFEIIPDDEQLPLNADTVG